LVFYSSTITMMHGPINIRFQTLSFSEQPRSSNGIWPRNDRQFCLQHEYA